MRHLARGMVAAWSAIAVACLVGCTSDRELAAPARVQAGEGASKKAKVKSGGPPPLVVERDAPLLLDDSPQPLPDNPAAGPVADNGPCYVCHANYEGEEMVVVHAVENVGCMDCHGKCYAHRDDENNITPPDIMFAPDGIDESCEECHETHDVAAAKVVARWQERALAGKALEAMVCTDCHGQHRLKFRTVRWDKRTRELIIEGEPRAGAAVDDGRREEDRP